MSPKYETQASRLLCRFRPGSVLFSSMLIGYVGYVGERETSAQRYNALLRDASGGGRLGCSSGPLGRRQRAKAGRRHHVDGAT
jgi:hypothetical protein